MVHYGLVVAMQDQGTSNWYEANDLLSNASNHDTNGAKFKDWRLPTKRELNLMYVVYTNGNGASLNANYLLEFYGVRLRERGEVVFYFGGQGYGDKSQADECACCSGFLVI